jgi:hypothetical protein
MGNQPSRPGPAAAAPAANEQICFPIHRLTPEQISSGQPKNPPAPDSSDAIQKARIELAMANNDKNNKQQTLDRLVPTEAQQRRIDKANLELNEYTAKTNKLYAVEIKLFDKIYDQINALYRSPAYAIVEKYKKNIDQKQTILSNEYMLNKEKAFTERRRFLDSQPQEGVEGVGWFSNVDEQILAVFWLSYILFLGTVITLLIMYYGIQYAGSLKNAITGGIVVFLILIVTGHFMIRNFALKY